MYRICYYFRKGSVSYSTLFIMYIDIRLRYVSLVLLLFGLAWDVVGVHGFVRVSDSFRVSVLRRHQSKSIYNLSSHSCSGKHDLNLPWEPTLPSFLGVIISPIFLGLTSTPFIFPWGLLGSIWVGRFELVQQDGRSFIFNILQLLSPLLGLQHTYLGNSRPCDQGLLTIGFP